MLGRDVIVPAAQVLDERMTGRYPIALCGVAVNSEVIAISLCYWRSSGVHPATSEATFKPAFAPLSVGTVRCSSASTASHASRANAATGTKPPPPDSASSISAPATGRTCDRRTYEMPFVMARIES